MFSWGVGNETLLGGLRCGLAKLKMVHLSVRAMVNHQALLFAGA